MENDLLNKVLDQLHLLGVDNDDIITIRVIGSSLIFHNPKDLDILVITKRPLYHMEGKRYYHAGNISMDIHFRTLKSHSYVFNQLENMYTWAAYHQYEYSIFGDVSPLDDYSLLEHPEHWLPFLQLFYCDYIGDNRNSIRQRA